MEPNPPDQQPDPDDGVVVQLADLAGDLYRGVDDRPPPVLLHGLTFSRRTWAPALQALRRIDPQRTVLVLDLPGHGASAALPSHRLERVADAVHGAVVEAGLSPPVVVGHSVSAIIATVYATKHPVSGVVNVDQSLQIVGFAQLLQSLADRLRGPEFGSMWEMFRASFHTELLPADAQEIVRSTSDPRQELVLSYWQEVLDVPPAELQAWSEAQLDKLRAVDCPYLLLAGHELDAADRQVLSELLPQATVAVWPATGHFPHLAHPQLFAEYLAATDRWPEGALSAIPPPRPARA